ncbi:PfkB family carbohydrate kinase [Rhizobium sp. CC-YZS058]|uniref:PfkB family carbohydrate kinase n=1 Tax=Rhizobium sp. CC-YZS058 TaxID=3042153 RepID=UPI002B05886C|nr:PfkB family carbohydrate kinase [Rhizobium sp. CC-YZS058]MEA3536671.1 PfkB family carbohydrate kinase [Rhizobium sp. CC-YZS058]
MTIHVVGNVCIDNSFHLERLPQPGETVNAETASEGLGGKGANQAVAAARTGAAVTLWAAVGRDAAADRMQDLLSAELDDLRLSRLDLPSDRSVVLVDGLGENVIVTAAACANAFDPLREGALPSAFRRGDMLLMQGNLPSRTTADCLRQARAAGLFTVLNPSPLPLAGMELGSLSLLIANRPEAQMLTGEADPQAAARRLRALSIDHIVITLGGDGAFLLDGDASLTIPAHPTDVVDTSGAGDCYTGTLAGLIHRGVPLARAAGVASAAAALSVSRPGTLAAFPTLADLDALIPSFTTDNT